MTNKSYKPHFEYLKKKWSDRHKLLHNNLFVKHHEALLWLHDSSKRAMIGSLASVLMMSHQPASNILAQNILPFMKDNAEEKPVRTKAQLIEDLSKTLPPTVEPLSGEQEKNIASILTSYFNMNITAELEHKRLNRTYGYIGAEQHLVRYPGDSIFTHFDSEKDSSYTASGMAPGRGAWGYFAESKDKLTEEDNQREKYYIAVPTFLAPGWNEHVHEYYAFFKYRKMFVVNPENGKAIITDIGDAGPSESTGKQLGGSPEVMRYLERVDGGGKGPVLYFFINDPEDKIPLGPVSLEQTHETLL